MNRKYISIGLLVLIALAFALLFWKGCGSKSEIRNPQSVIVPAVDNPPVVAPQFPPSTVPDPNPRPDVQRELDHYKNRYAHYKGLAWEQGKRLAALDSLLAAEGLSCEEKERLLAEKIKELEAGEGVAADLVDDLNAALAPRRDTGRVETADYSYRWQFDHFGRMLPGGHIYDIDIKPRTVQCPDCPEQRKPRRRSLAALYGQGWDGRNIYAGEARLSILKGRVDLIGLAGWDGQPLGLVGVGWSW